MSDPLNGPTMELRVLPRARTGELVPEAVEADDEIDADSAAVELTTQEGEVILVDPEPMREMVQRELLVTMTRFQGPIPPPDALAAYEALLPGAADRLMAMAEREQQHRFMLERVETEAPFIAARRGQFLGFAIAGLVMACSLVMVLKDHEVAGGIIGGLDLLGLAALFVTSGRSARSSRDDTSGEASEEPSPGELE
ncbi:DUF2335 domain-containing protein [Catellatospora citrea]|nr:DUF2335 domain-containing protein [Catellatospora citrea]RKE10520.1 putative membrane protein [Catellatospora citrea]